MTDLGRAGVYAAAWIPATIVAALAEGLAISALNATSAGRSSSWALSFAVNVIPALLGALIVFLPVAYYLHRAGAVSSVSAHLVRASILYGLVVLLTVLLVTSRRNPDFGLFAQLLLWPALGGITGIVADLLVWGLATPSVARSA